MHQAFFDVFESLHRGGPGSKESTLKALNLIPDLPKDLKILDVGSGPGQQTLDLAEALPRAEILAIDRHEPFIKKLNQRAKEAGLSDRVNAEVGDMFDLTAYADESFDIIWCEGAIYFIGFTRGLEEWARLLKPGGAIAVSHIFKGTENVSQEVLDIFRMQDCEFFTVEKNLKLIPEQYRLLGHFPLTDSDWLENFYDHEANAARSMKEKWKHDPQALEELSSCITEREVFLRNSGSYGYEFYVLKKK